LPYDYRHIEEAAITTDFEDLSAWWFVLEDPVLNGLVDQAVRQNLSLQEAGVRILEARAQRGITRGDLFPQADATGSYNRSRFATNGSGFTNGMGGGGFGENPVDQWSFGLTPTWEIDVFGKLRRAVEAADADIGVSVEDYRDILVILLADLATNYVDARAFQERLTIAHANLAAQRRTLEIARRRFDGGFTSELDVAQASANANTTEAEIPNLEIGYQQAVNRLSTLLGGFPGDVDDLLIEPEPIPQTDQEIAIGIPAGLLRRRPDIRRSERELAAQTARIGQSVADLYPQFTLNGSFSLGAQDFSKLFASNAIGASAGPSFRWNILNFGRIRFNIDVQELRADEAAIRYQSTVLTAAEEVDSALIAYAREQRRRDSLRKAVIDNERAVDLSEQQYERGTTNFQRVVDSQRSLLQTQDQLAQSKATVTTNLIQLFRALGGGWQFPHDSEANFNDLRDVPTTDFERLPAPRLEEEPEN
jgi:NodT family efflux transporter outer membrane factor (OMF) lipoprotein